jgi:hypothetical protein
LLYDLDERSQISGTDPLSRGVRYEQDGYIGYWRAIRDDKERIVVAMCFNSDLHNAREWADSPQYPERYASLAFRLDIYYIVYSMTH